MTKQDNEKLTNHVNFRLAKEMYLELMEYLRKTNASISVFMREATYNYLKLKEKLKLVEENGCRI